MARNFVVPEFFDSQEVYKISFTNPNIFLPTSQIFVGTECKDFIKCFSGTIIIDFKNMCLQFYSTAAEKIAKRLPVKNQFFKEFEFLDPNICLDPKKLNMAIDLKFTRETFQ